jgi:hypothetical protein
MEEGLDIELLDTLVGSMAAQARAAGVIIAAGDTKVVEGNGGLYINTTGIGLIPEGRDVSSANCREGDVILCSGNLGDHHACILSHRMEIENDIASDCAALNDIVDALFAALKASEGCRHLFLASHAPISPSDNWGFYWFLLGDEPRFDEVRRRLRRELVRSNAIVLAGHVHCTSLMEWKTSEGTLTQFIANSVWTRPEQMDAPLVADDPRTFGSLYVNKHVNDKPDEYDGKYTVRTRKESLALMAEYADMTTYRRWNDAGHYRLEVSGDNVDMLFYAGDSREVKRRFRLR